VRVVEIDVVGAETREARVGRRGDRARGETAELGVLAHLGRDHDIRSVARVRHPSADDRLGLATRIARNPGGVGIGRVDQVSPAGDEGVEHGPRRRLVARPAERVAPESQGKNGEIR
jgi:hypothetical protein